MRAFGYLLGWLGVLFVLAALLFMATLDEHDDYRPALIFWAVVSPVLLWTCRPARPPA
jgi:hypothetical protein